MNDCQKLFQRILEELIEDSLCFGDVTPKQICEVLHAAELTLIVQGRG